MKSISQKGNDIDMAYEIAKLAALKFVVDGAFERVTWVDGSCDMLAGQLPEGKVIQVKIEYVDDPR